MKLVFNPLSGTFDFVEDLSGYVPYTGATATLNLGSQDFTTTGNVGIGTTPTVPLHVRKISPTDYTLTETMRLESNAFNLWYLDCYSNVLWASNIQRARRARGTIDIPASSEAYDVGMRWSSMFYVNGAFEESCLMSFTAGSTMSPYSSGKMLFWTKPATEEWVIERMSIDENGVVKVNSDFVLDSLKSKSYLGTDANGKVIEATVDLSGYVPYTGATGSLTLGVYSLTAKSLITTETTGTHLTLGTNDLYTDDTVLLTWGTDGFGAYAGTPFRMYWSNADIGNGAVMFDDGSGNPISISAIHYGNGTGLTGIGKLAYTNTWTQNNIFSTSVTTPQIYGASTASGNLTLTSTSHATKGNVYLNSSAGLGHNGVTGNAWIGTESATYLFNIAGASRNPNQGCIYFRSDQSSAKGTLQSQIKSYARYRLKTSATRYVFALDFQPNYTFDTANVAAGGYISAIYCSPQLDFQANSCSGAVIGTTINPIVMFGTATGCTVNSVKGLWFQQPSVTGTGTITDWSAIVVQKHFIATSNYAIKLEENTDSGGTSKYGIYIEDISGAATNNYAIYTGTGAVRFGDTVLGASTIEATTGFKVGGTAAIADNTYTFDASIYTTISITTKGGIITAISVA